MICIRTNDAFHLNTHNLSSHQVNIYPLCRLNVYVIVCFVSSKTAQFTMKLLEGKPYVIFSKEYVLRVKYVDSLKIRTVLQKFPDSERIILIRNAPKMFSKTIYSRTNLADL